MISIPEDTELIGAAAGTGRPLPREPGRLEAAAVAGMGMPLLFRPSTRLEGRELQWKTEKVRVDLKGRLALTS